MRKRSVASLFFGVSVLVFTSLACRAATRLIVPDTPTPLPPTGTPTVIPSPTVPPATATPVFQAACPSLLADIMVEATKEEVVSGPSSMDRTDDSSWGYLVIYTLKDDKLWQRREVHVPDEFEKDLDTRAAHEWIWDYFAAIIPAQERDFVTQFSVMTDGRENILGAVGRNLEEPTEWSLRVDIVDANNHYRLSYTLMHEFGHLLTLKLRQVAFDKTVFYNPDNDELYERALSACSQYFTQEGCSSPTSYINAFFIRYWKTFYSEWQEIDKEKSDSSYESSLHSFYKTYSDQFLTEYAATSPEEDIAESWAFFVLAPKPESASIANEKILFFYEYPELVQLRQEILTRLCVEFPK